MSNELRGHKNYYNIKYDTGKLDGLFLIKGERWTFLYGSDLPTAPGLCGESRNENHYDRYPVDLSRVYNLNNVLPLPATLEEESVITENCLVKRRTQQVRPRGLLPMELDGGS